MQDLFRRTQGLDSWRRWLGFNRQSTGIYICQHLPCPVGGAISLFDRLHLGKCQEERQGRLSALVLVGSIGMEPVATSTCGRVVEGLTEVVAPEEPLERRLRFHEPGRVVGNFVCRETR